MDTVSLLQLPALSSVAGVVIVVDAVTGVDAVVEVIGTMVVVVADFCRPPMLADVGSVVRSLVEAVKFYGWFNMMGGKGKKA